MAARLFPIPIRATFAGGESIWSVFLCDTAVDLPSTASAGDFAILLDTGNSRRYVGGVWTAASPAANSVDTGAIQDGAVTLAKTSGVQATLVSETNIKTVNGSSLLGSGDLAISGSGLTQPQVLARGLGA